MTNTTEDELAFKMVFEDGKTITIFRSGAVEGDIKPVMIINRIPTLIGLGIMNREHETGRSPNPTSPPETSPAPPPAVPQRRD